MTTQTLEKLNTEELEINFSHLTIKETFDVLSSSALGLSQEEVEKRIKIYGLNSIPEKKKKTKFSIFLSNFNSPLVYALFAAAFFAGLIGKLVDVAVIVFVVFLNAFIGFIQEIKAEKELLL